MKAYTTPTMIPLGSLHEMTLQDYPGGTITKLGGASDAITSVSGLGGPITISS